MIYGRHGVPSKAKQAPFASKLVYQPPNSWFKIVQQSLVIANLPAPLHYFNFKALIGQPNVPIFKNHLDKKNTLDIATTINSVSPHMVGQFNQYSIQQDCFLAPDLYQFGPYQQLKGQFPTFDLLREDDELSVELNIKTQMPISHFARLKFGMGLYQHWALMCRCQGVLTYKGQSIQVDQFGSFEYARAFNVPFFALYLYTYQIIQLADQRQLILLHLRNHYNQILQSKIFVRAQNTACSHAFDQNVEFNTTRVYPKTQGGDLSCMYLPREFHWYVQQGAHRIVIHAQSRGDFKSGLGRGYVGSFQYQIQIDDYYEEGCAGYCEYIDLRPLDWQEIQQEKGELNYATVQGSAVLKEK